ncbi:MAG: hypothetical protein RQ729_09195 [Wenzhouxiangellaceae bacterium]|nr:hypothetical protein [Wenzhouxiangellaceae bacterium]
MKNRLTLIALFALFLLPISVAVVLNSRWVDWQPDPARAHGELLQPVLPIGAFELADASGQTRSAEDLADRWHLVWLAPSPCNQPCFETLALMHNIRLAQDRRAGEVGLLVLGDGRFEPDQIAQLAALDARFLLFDGASSSQLRAHFPAAQTGAFYIVDPAGNIMERFEPATDPTGIRKDLDRLLTWTSSD